MCDAEIKIADDEREKSIKDLCAEFWKDKEFILKEAMGIYVKAESQEIKLRCLELMRSFW